MLNYDESNDLNIKKRRKLQNNLDINMNMENNINNIVNNNIPNNNFSSAGQFISNIQQQYNEHSNEGTSTQQ